MLDMIKKNADILGLLNVSVGVSKNRRTPKVKNIIPIKNDASISLSSSPFFHILQ